MLKADVKRFENLASADEPARVAAAVQLQQLEFRHFDDHPAGKFRFSDDEVRSLLSNWHSTSSELVKIWIAQALALTETSTPEVQRITDVLADTLRFDGHYMPEVAEFLSRYLPHMKEGNAVIKSLYRHPNPDVRWRCVLALRSMAFQNELDYASDMPIVRALMLDSYSSVRHEAVMTAMGMPEHTLADYDVLLDVVNMDNGSARHYAKEMMTTLEASVPGCTPSAFEPRTPLLRTDGIYCTGKSELDANGVWVSSACLRFFSDSTVSYFTTNIAPVHMPKLLPGLQSSASQGWFVKKAGEIAFSVSGKSCFADFKGLIDGQELTLRCTQHGTGRHADEKYRFIFVDWLALPPTELQVPPKAPSEKKKASLPFKPVSPKSMLAADAAKWYLQMLARMPLMLDSAHDHTERVTLGWKIKSEMRDVAARAMYDPSLKKEFFAKLPLPSLEELQAQEPAAALKLLLAVTQAERRAFPGTIGESIGLQYWDGKQQWVMTEDGWAPLSPT